MQELSKKVNSQTVSKILITGGTGLIGTQLSRMLVDKGHTVSHLSREKKEGPIRTYVWDVGKRFIEDGALEDVDTIIHLAGAGIADKPWSESRKREILESRTHSTRLLFEELKRRGDHVRHFISASAVGYYGFADADHLLTEEDEPGTDFLATVVKKWEEEVDQINSIGLRVVKVRVGIVLSTEGGALKEMVRPVKFYAGAPFGTGNQYMSWIHIDDLCRVFIQAVEDTSFNGAFNAVGPYPVTNRQLTHAIGKTLGKKVFLPPVPSFVLRLLFGEMAELVLKGNKVSSKKLQASGFTYKFKTLEDALADLLRS
jgi:uncharacterized protein